MPKDWKTKAKWQWRLYKIYEYICLENYPEFKGRLYKKFYATLYPHLVIGKNYRIRGKFYLTMYDPLNGSISIGDNLVIVSEEKSTGITLFSKCKITTFPGANICIGDNVALSGTVITSKKSIEIGSNTMIAPNVMIMDSDFHVHWPPERRRTAKTGVYDKEVKIGENVWIGANSLILKGVCIGDNSIIGAGSVVVKDVPSNVIAAGNPARIIESLPSVVQENELSQSGLSC
jgi:acetyltransferase-like isoleucine patch superfamily enzyme